jgi:hypothetical protein
VVRLGLARGFLVNILQGSAGVQNLVGFMMVRVRPCGKTPGSDLKKNDFGNSNEGASEDSRYRSFSDPVRLFWYQDFSGAGGQIQVFISFRNIPIGSGQTDHKTRTPTCSAPSQDYLFPLYM